jgi:hypothetical protein
VSRSKLIRAALAAASLLGAIPLLAQRSAGTVAVRSSAPATFPYGRYSSPPPADQPGAGNMEVEFAPGRVVVRGAGRPEKNYGMSATGDTWTVWQTTGGCADPEMILGVYQWTFVGGVLSFSPLDDKCPGRAEKMGSVKLTRIEPGADPTMPPVADGASAFPFGRYVIQPLPNASQNGAGLFVEIGNITTKVFNGGDLVETHGSAVDGDVWHIFEFTGDCLDDGSYHWHYADGVLTFEIITDPCTQRASNVSVVRLVRQP